MARAPAAFKKLDQATQTNILDALRAGNTRRVAANACEVSEALLKHWLATIPRFKTAVEKAEAEAEMTMVAVMVDNAKTWNRWQPALQWLSRRRAVDWAEIQRFEVYQKIEEIKELQEELAGEGIDVTVQQLLADYQQMAEARKGRKGKLLKALPPPVAQA
jgi:hypothetical protein